MWLLLLACGRGCGSDLLDSPGDSVQPSDSEDTGDSRPPGPQRFEGQGGGYGSRLAGGAAEVWVAAPWFEDSGAIYLLGEQTPTLSGERSLGLGLASEGSTLVAEAPLANEGLYGTRAAFEELLLVQELEGVHVDEDFVQTPGRPWSSTLVGERQVVGIAQQGVWTEEGWLAQAEQGSELGLSACSSDLNGDGQEDLAVGAPGANEVHVWLQLEGSPLVLEGPEGRFGQALSCAQQLLAVGAPLYGEGGAAWRIEGLTVGEPLLQGEPADRLGQDVLLVGEALYAGAPGAPDSPGAVLLAR